MRGEAEERPAFWAKLAAQDLLGLHVPEEHGGAGYGLLEAAVAIEALAEKLTPGPLVPTVLASAAILAAEGKARAELVPGLAEGTLTGAVALTAGSTVLGASVPLHTDAVRALAGAGANRLYGIAFDVAEPRPSVDAARREAVADARAKAELYAEAAGVTLGPVVTIRESVGMGGPEPLRAKAAMEAAPVAEGTVTLTADVEVVFGIE